MLQWAVTLGRVDIMCATMPMGVFWAQPRIGHMDRLKRIFGFLRRHKKSAVKFRTGMPDYSQYPPKEYDWQYVYWKVIEELPRNMAKAKGNKVK